MADGPLPIQGVDYAFPPRPNIQQLAAADPPIKFACRYGGPGSIDKQLDPDEARALSAAGVAIVANAEGAAGGLVGGYSTGASWARSAEARFKACGMPPGRPIYLSVDFDVQSNQWAAVASALRGAADVLGGVHRVGIYGGRHAIEWARRDGVAEWFWQTYAWSSGIWVPGNHIEQYHNGVSLAGADVDLDRALTGDFGQWTVNGADDMTPQEHAWLYNTAQIIYALAALWLEVDVVNAETGKHYMLDLRPYWEKVAGAELTPADVAAVAEAAGKGAAAGATGAVAGLSFDLKLDGTAHQPGAHGALDGATPQAG